MNNSTIPGCTADAASETSSRRYRTKTDRMNADSNQIVRENVVVDFFDWLGDKIDDAVDWVGGEVCSKCATLGAATAITCTYGTDGIGFAGGTCGELGTAVALGFKIGCGNNWSH